MLDSLKHFLLIVEHGTFTEAAKHAFLTQPSLSASIRRLEDQLGAPLLHRLPRGAAPTAAGQALIPRAKAALGAVADARRAVAEVMGLQRGEVRIGAGSIAVSHLLPDLLASFRIVHPELIVRVRESYTPGVAPLVRSGELDLGISQLPVQGHFESLCLDEYVLVCRPDRVDDVWDGQRLRVGAPTITFGRSAALRRALDANFSDLDLIIELGSVTAIQSFVAAGMGVALLSRRAVQHDLENGKLSELTDPRLPPPRALVLVHAGVERLSPAALALRAHLLQGLARQSPTVGKAVQHA
jgi:DNA-binding transcriptional LysR family regulator